MLTPTLLSFLVLATGCGSEPHVLPVVVEGPTVDAASFARLLEQVPESACEVQPRLLAAGLSDASPERFAPLSPWLRSWAGDKVPDDAVRQARQSVCEAAPHTSPSLGDRAAALQSLETSCALTRQGLHTADTLSATVSPDAALLGAHVYRELRAGGVAETDARTVAGWISDRGPVAARPVLGALPDDVRVPVAQGFPTVNLCRCHRVVRGTPTELQLDGAPVSVADLDARVTPCEGSRRLDVLWVGDRDVPMGTVLDVATALLPKGGMRAVVADDEGATVDTPATGFLLLPAREPGAVTLRLSATTGSVWVGDASVAEGPVDDLPALLASTVEAHDPDRVRYVVQLPAAMPWGEAAPLVAKLHAVHPGLGQATFGLP